MKITPRSEEEFKSRNLIDPGTYDFVIFDATEKVSKNSGDPMIELILKVTDMNRRVHTLYDYLMDKEPMDYKIRHLYESLGLISKYDSGNIDASDLHNKKGKVQIIIQKDKKGIYSDKNSVKDYIVSKCSAADPFNDDIAF